MEIYEYLISDGKMLEIFATSYFQTFDFFIESNLKWIESKIDSKGKADILELDVLAKKYHNESIETMLIECKRGCTFNDLFKFSGISKLLKSDRDILLCKSNDLLELKKIGEEIGVEVVEPEELVDNIDNEILDLKFKMFAKTNILCNKFVEKDYIRQQSKTFEAKENKAYNDIRSYMSILIGQVWKETDCVKRANWISNLLIEYKDFVRYIGRNLEIKPGNKDSDYYMLQSPICQAAGFIVLKVKISYIICAIECAIYLDEKDLKELRDMSFKNVVEKFKENLYHAVKIPTFLQNFIYIFGGIYSSIDDDVSNIAKYNNETIENVLGIFSLLKELFKMEGLGIQWGFTDDMGVSALKYLPTPLKGLGIQNRKLLNYSVDGFCFAEQWEKTTIEMEG